MSEITIGPIIARQFDRMWASLREAIANLSDDQWRTSDCDWLTPARIAYHIVETAEFYSRDNPQQSAEPLDWDNGPVDRLPSRQQLLADIGRVQPLVRNWLTACTDQAYLLNEKEFDWTGDTRLDRAIYSLRHAQHHLGQINAELRRRNLPRGTWA